MRRSLTIFSVAVMVVFSATACGGQGADQQQLEQQQQRIEELEQQVQQQQQQIEELQAAPQPETTTPAPGATQEGTDVAPLPETTPT